MVVVGWFSLHHFLSHGAFNTRGAGFEHLSAACGSWLSLTYRPLPLWVQRGIFLGFGQFSLCSGKAALYMPEEQLSYFCSSFFHGLSSDSISFCGMRGASFPFSKTICPFILPVFLYIMYISNINIGSTLVYFLHCLIPQPSDPFLLTQKLRLLASWLSSIHLLQIKLVNQLARQPSMCLSPFWAAAHLLVASAQLSLLIGIGIVSLGFGCFWLWWWPSSSSVSLLSPGEVTHLSLMSLWRVCAFYRLCNLIPSMPDHARQPETHPSSRNSITWPFRWNLVTQASSQWRDLWACVLWPVTPSFLWHFSFPPGQLILAAQCITKSLTCQAQQF